MVEEAHHLLSWRQSCASVLILNSRGRSRSCRRSCCRGGRSRSCGRSRGGRRDGLLNSRLDRDGLLNRHGTRRPSQGSFLLITTTNAPDEESNKYPHSERSQEECPREPQVPPPSPPRGIPSPAHETRPSLIVVVAGSGLIIHELHSFLPSHLSLSRRAARGELRRIPLTRTWVNRGKKEGPSRARCPSCRRSRLRSARRATPWPWRSCRRLRLPHWALTRPARRAASLFRRNTWRAPPRWRCPRSSPRGLFQPGRKRPRPR
jgi:hypothetical protein